MQKNYTYFITYNLNKKRYTMTTNEIDIACHWFEELSLNNKVTNLRLERSVIIKEFNMKL